MRYESLRGYPVILCCLLLLCQLACRANETSPAAEPESPPSTTAEQQQALPPMRGALVDFQKARAAVAADEIETALAASQRALEGMPHHPMAIRLTASLLARLGQHDAALELLERIDELGGKVELAVDDQAWTALKEDQRFKALVAALKPEAGGSGPRGELAITLDDAELYPEGIAFDPRTQTFLVGSMTRSKILRVAMDGSSSDLVAEQQDGLINPLGMAVDVERRGLWVASSAYPPHGGATPDDAGRSAVFHFDVDTGKLRQRFELDERPLRHFLNDLDVSAAGEVFITDSETCRLYHVDPEAATLEVFIELPEINAINGIALSDDDRLLYVVHLEGMTRVDLATREVSRVSEAPGVSMAHGDGMAFVDNSLIVIQNQPSFDFRVARYFLDPAGQRAERQEVLHAGLVGNRMPFTGAVVGDAFYFNVTSNLDDRGEEPQPPALLRVQL